MKTHVIPLILFFFMLNPLAVWSQNPPDSSHPFSVERLSPSEMLGLKGEWNIGQHVFNKAVMESFKKHTQDTGEKGNRRPEPIKTNIPASLGVDSNGILGSGSGYTIPPLRFDATSPTRFSATTPETYSARR